jgi:hypothetical protein
VVVAQDLGRFDVLRSLVDPPSFHCLRWSGICPGGARLRNHAVSATFTEGVRFMEPEYSPACLAFSQPLGDDDHPVGVGFARACALAMRSRRKSIIVWME